MNMTAPGAPRNPRFDWRGDFAVTSPVNAGVGGACCTFQAMNDDDLFKLLGQSGVAVVCLGVVGKMGWKAFLRLLAAVDKQTVKIDDHTKADTAALTEIGHKVENLAANLSQAFSDQSDELSRDLARRTGDLSQELAEVRKDLAVLGTRVDTVIDWGDRTPAGAARRLARQHREPPQEIPVLDVKMTKRPPRGGRDDE